MSDLEIHYSVEEAAKRLGGLSPRTLYNWASQGKIKKVKVGARFMIAESELRRLLIAGAETKTQTQPDSAEEHERVAVA
jgi:excisionase family DNA binding protein